MRRFVLVLPLLASTAFAQPPATPPEVTRAQAAMQAGQVDSAITELEGYFTRNPNAALGRLLLGNAYRQRRNPVEALASYHKVTLPLLARLPAMFNMAGIHAAA